MSEPFVGEIRMVGFSFAPQGWAFCDGSLLSISEYETLFNLTGTTYGGDGQTTFALPDLRGRVPLHQGQGSGLSSYIQGQSGGASAVTLNINQLPAHAHPLVCQNTPGTASAPAGQVFASASSAIYSAPGAAANMTTLVSSSGGSQAHDNMQPYLTINYIISLFGVFPSQS